VPCSFSQCRVGTRDVSPTVFGRYNRLVLNLFLIGLDKAAHVENHAGGLSGHDQDVDDILAEFYLLSMTLFVGDNGNVSSAMNAVQICEVDSACYGNYQ